MGTQEELDRCREQHEAVVRQLDAKYRQVAEIKTLIGKALDELGAPDASYPAPVANAVDLLRQAQAVIADG